MFVWVEMYFGDMSHKTDEEDDSVLTPERQFWIRLADAGLLTESGWFFSRAKHAEGGVSFGQRGPPSWAFSIELHAVGRGFLPLRGACRGLLPFTE
jgi:hypothetical protein